ncbi:hypothetical protein L6452_18859 [Arctium lappa]|uniref:Uncharacterized protein n=1 Tax=Arctium lappa TaxID=4217 RepID=A0ACB9C7M1_ARCLA|nr:hypothetical protein L6452_18859 [Arctium lappa]
MEDSLGGKILKPLETTRAEEPSGIGSVLVEVPKSNHENVESNGGCRVMVKEHDVLVRDDASKFEVSLDQVEISPQQKLGSKYQRKRNKQRGGGSPREVTEAHVTEHMSSINGSRKNKNQGSGPLFPKSNPSTPRSTVDDKHSNKLESQSMQRLLGDKLKRKK